MEKRRRILALLIATGLIAVAAACLAFFFSDDPYPREMRPLYAVIAAGEQGWGDEGTKLLNGIVARSPDRHALAERLLKESDGSLVAEGMILAVRSNHPQAKHLVEQKSGDHRWNWYLADNDELASQLLLHLDGKPTENWVSAEINRTIAK